MWWSVETEGRGRRGRTFERWNLEWREAARPGRVSLGLKIFLDF
jgi:hypothetical protein